MKQFLMILYDVSGCIISWKRAYSSTDTLISHLILWYFSDSDDSDAGQGSGDL